MSGCHVMTGHVILGQVISRYVRICVVWSGSVILDHVRSG